MNRDEMLDRLAQAREQVLPEQAWSVRVVYLADNREVAVHLRDAINIDLKEAGHDVEVSDVALIVAPEISEDTA